MTANRVEARPGRPPSTGAPDAAAARHPPVDLADRVARTFRAVPARGPTTQPGGARQPRRTPDRPRRLAHGVRGHAPRPDHRCRSLPAREVSRGAVAAVPVGCGCHGRSRRRRSTRPRRCSGCPGAGGRRPGPRRRRPGDRRRRSTAKGPPGPCRAGCRDPLDGVGDGGVADAHRTVLVAPGHRPDHRAQGGEARGTQRALGLLGRGALDRCLDGLTEDQARRSPVPSRTTLLGLAKRATSVEKVWFDEAVTGRDRHPRHTGPRARCPAARPRRWPWTTWSTATGAAPSRCAGCTSTSCANSPSTADTRTSCASNSSPSSAPRPAVVTGFYRTCVIDRAGERPLTPRRREAARPAVAGPVRCRAPVAAPRTC